MNFYFLNWLKVNPFLRFLARAVLYSFFGSLTAVSVISIFSDLSWLRYAGIGLLAALIYFYWQARRRSANRVLERAVDRVLFFGAGDFYLNVFKILLEKKSTRKMFLEKNISLAEMESKLDEYIERGREEPIQRADLFSKLDNLLKAAWEAAQKRKSDTLEVQDLYLALSRLREEKISQLFKNFGIPPHQNEK